jgi:hypothetical protein
MKVSILDRERFNKSISKSSKRLASIGEDSVLIYSKNSESYQIKNRVQKGIYSHFKDPVFERVIKPALLLECISSENRVGGSGDATFKIFSDLISEDFEIFGKNHKIDASLEKVGDIIINNIKKNGSLCTYRDINRFLNQEIKNLETRNLIKKSIEYSGIRNKIFSERSAKQKSHIEIREGFFFDMLVDPAFLKKAWKKRDAIAIVLDGAIIEVSEIHHLLEFCNSTGTPAIIFCRNVSPDVLNTLHVNMMRGTLDVIPVEIQIEEENVNMLKDIAISTGSDMICVEKGDVLSSSIRGFIENGFSYIDFIKIDSTGISITNKSSQESVKNHINSLNTTRQSADQEEVKRIDRRIRALSSDRVIISVGQDQIIKNPTCVEEIDSFLRSLAGFINFGKVIIEKDLFEYKNNNLSKFEAKITESIKRSLLGYNKKIISAAALAQSIRTSLSLVSNFSSIDCLLLEDRK